MDIRSKLKLFNEEILVSTSCVDDGGNHLFNSWYFPKTVDSSYCGFLASQEWVENCAFFDKINACGFHYSKSCGLLIEPTGGSRFHFSDSGSFSVTSACGLTINASCHDVCVYAKEGITLCADSDELDKDPSYIQIGYYESQDQDKIGITAYGENVIISSKNNTSIDSGTLDISSDGELNITAEGKIRISTYCTEFDSITVSTASVFDQTVYFRPDSVINVQGKTTFHNTLPKGPENASITENNQLVPKSYVDDAVAAKNGFCFIDNDGKMTSSAYYGASYGDVICGVLASPGSGIKFPGPDHYIAGNNSQMLIRGGNLDIFGCCTLTLYSYLDTHIESSQDLTITSGCRIKISTDLSGYVSEFTVESKKICLTGPVTADYLTVGCTSVFTCDSTFGNNATVTFGCAPFLTNVNNISAAQLVTKSYVDNATATSFFCTYTDTEEHTISIGTNGIRFSPEKIQIHGCGGKLLIDGESNDSRIDFDLDTGFNKVPSVINTNLCLGNGFGHTYFATEAYVDRKLSETYCSFFNDGLTVGRGACVVEINTDTDVILFNETELPTTGGTVLTSKTMPCTCVWWLEPKSPDENGKVTWTCELMHNGQHANSDIPPNVVVTKIDESNSDKFHYVDADVSFWTSGDMGVINSSYISVNMNSNDAIPQCTFKVTISNIHINNSLT